MVDQLALFHSRPAKVEPRPAWFRHMPCDARHGVGRQVVTWTAGSALDRIARDLAAFEHELGDRAVVLFVREARHG